MAPHCRDGPEVPVGRDGRLVEIADLSDVHAEMRCKLLCHRGRGVTETAGSGLVGIMTVWGYVSVNRPSGEGRMCVRVLQYVA